MRLPKHQRGMGLWGIVFILFLIGFTAFTTLKLFPVYMEDFAIESSLNSIEQDAAAEYRGIRAVKEAVQKRLGVNNVKVLNSDDINVVRDGEFYLIDIDYEVTIPFISNISLLVTFQHAAQVRAGI